MEISTFEVVIGLEVHVQLSTFSKAFCGDSTQFGAHPNTQVSPISLGHPGTLPFTNRKHVEYAVQLGLALGSEINLNSRFDRKNYFYPDLPKGYQITQDKSPICVGGKFHGIRIHHVHMEEDAGKSMHLANQDFSIIDLNRAGVPLLEIVTEPDFRSAEEVEEFMFRMRQLVRYLGISDGNMEQGSLRCDCNVSVRKKGQLEFEERCEIKNLNSMKFAKRAIEFEFLRQIKILNSGESVQRQTLHFDAEKGTTHPIRQKEDANDYRYFPEPDLPPVILTEEEVQKIASNLPMLPNQMESNFLHQFGLSEYEIKILATEPETAYFFKKFCVNTKYYKQAANLTINKILPYCQENHLQLDTLESEIVRFAQFLNLIEEGKVSHSIAYQQLFPEMMAKRGVMPIDLAIELNITQESDENFLEAIIKEVLMENEMKVIEYKKGKKGLLALFMGQVMRKSGGKADPKVAGELLNKFLKT